MTVALCAMQICLQDVLAMQAMWKTFEGSSLAKGRGVVVLCYHFTKY